MCSNDVLAERIDNVIDKVDAIAKALNKHVEDQNKLLERLDDRYPTRRELKAVKRAGGVMIALVGIISSVFGIVK